MDEQSQQLTKKQRKELKRQEKLAQREKVTRSKKLRNILLILFIVLMIGGLGWFIPWIVGKGEIVPPDDDPFLGPKDAKLTITEFSDFSCPACQSAASNIRQAVNAYPDKVKLVYNSFNLGHKWSEKSAQAGECAYSQGKFWEFHDLIFEKQNDWVDDAGAIDKFKSYAKEVGLEENRFNQCLDLGQTKDKVDYDMKEAIAKKVVSTPTFFIGEQTVLGAKSVEEFKTLIDEELKK